MQLSDIISTEVRRGEEQQAVTELPAGLDQSGPGLFVAATVTTQPAAGLEGTNRSFGGRAEGRRLGAGGGWKPGDTEAALQIAYGLAALTGCQREVGRNSLSSCSS